MQSVEIEVTLDDLRLFTSGLVLDEEKDEELMNRLVETTVKVHMLRCAEEVKVEHEQFFIEFFMPFKISFFILYKMMNYWNWGLLGDTNVRFPTRSVKSR